MARGVNKVILIGNLCADPEVRAMPNGNQVTNVTIATNESWNDKNTGQKQERAEFHRVVFFGKLAEITGQYLKKGASVYVEGTLRTRKWQDKEGQDRYTTEIVCDMNGQMQMLGGGDGQQSQQSAPKQQRTAQNMPKQGVGQIPQQQSNQQWKDDFDDEISF